MENHTKRNNGMLMIYVGAFGFKYLPDLWSWLGLAAILIGMVTIPIAPNSKRSKGK